MEARRRPGAGAGPKGPPQKRYITPDGFQTLEDELQQLWRVERPRVTREVTEAAAQGDRSENAEYIYGKKRLREIDRRIRFLSKRLDEVTVVGADPPDQDRVFFGAWVQVEDENGREFEYRVVGPDEFDVAAARISMDSPLGKALLGCREGDEFVLQRPKGPISYTVVGIRYGDRRPQSPRS